jgi:hypothetical protein
MDNVEGFVTVIDVDGQLCPRLLALLKRKVGFFGDEVANMSN